MVCSAILAIYSLGWVSIWIHCDEEGYNVPYIYQLELLLLIIAHSLRAYRFNVYLKKGRKGCRMGLD